METKSFFKDILLAHPVDIFNDDSDVRESNIELVEEREVEGILTREVGSANLFLASAFLSTINGIELPTKTSEDHLRSKNLWTAMILELKKENFIREKPSSLRESFKVV